MTGIATARSLAKLGAATVVSSGPDLAMLHDTAWGLGCNVPGGPLFPGVGRGREFGAPGANGTLLYCNLDDELAIGYMRNQLLLDVPDPRTWPLVEAVYECLDRR